MYILLVLFGLSDDAPQWLRKVFYGRCSNPVPFVLCGVFKDCPDPLKFAVHSTWFYEQTCILLCHPSFLFSFTMIPPFPLILDYSALIPQTPISILFPAQNYTTPGRSLCPVARELPPPFPLRSPSPPSPIKWPRVIPSPPSSPPPCESILVSQFRLS